MVVIGDKAESLQLLLEQGRKVHGDGTYAGALKRAGAFGNGQACRLAFRPWAQLTPRYHAALQLVMGSKHRTLTLATEDQITFWLCEKLEYIFYPGNRDVHRFWRATGWPRQTVEGVFTAPLHAVKLAECCDDALAQVPLAQVERVSVFVLVRELPDGWLLRRPCMATGSAYDSNFPSATAC